MPKRGGRHRSAVGVQTDEASHSHDVAAEEKKEAAALTTSSINSALAKVELEAGKRTSPRTVVKKPMPPSEKGGHTKGRDGSTIDTTAHSTEVRGEPKKVQPQGEKRQSLGTRPVADESDKNRKKSVTSARAPERDDSSDKTIQSAKPRIGGDAVGKRKESSDEHAVVHGVKLAATAIRNKSIEAEAVKIDHRKSSDSVAKPQTRSSSESNQDTHPSKPGARSEQTIVHGKELNGKTEPKQVHIPIVHKTEEPHVEKEVVSPIRKVKEPVKEEAAPRKVVAADSSVPKPQLTVVNEQKPVQSQQILPAKGESQNLDSSLSNTQRKKVSPPSPRKPTVPLDVGHIAAPRSTDAPAQAPTQRQPEAMWPLLPDKSAPRMAFDKQQQRAVESTVTHTQSNALPVPEETLDATAVTTDGQTGRRAGELVSVGDRKTFRIVGDPVIDAMEERVRERKEKDRLRKEKEERRIAEQKAADERRAIEEEDLRARHQAEESERKRLEVDRKREKIRQMEEDRVKRLAKGQLKADMDIITGSKGTLEKFENARRKEQLEAEAELAGRVAMSKESAKNRRGSKLKKDIEEHQKASLEREKYDAEQRRAREHEARERNKALSHALETTLSGTAPTSDLIAALSNTAGAEEATGLSKALLKIRKEEEEKKKAAEQKHSPRTVTVSPAKPFKTKPFVPPQSQSSPTDSQVKDPHPPPAESPAKPTASPTAPSSGAPNTGSPKSKQFTEPKSVEPKPNQPKVEKKDSAKDANDQNSRSEARSGVSPRNIQVKQQVPKPSPKVAKAAEAPMKDEVKSPKTTPRKVAGQEKDKPTKVSQSKTEKPANTEARKSTVDAPAAHKRTSHFEKKEKSEHNQHKVADVHKINSSDSESEKVVKSAVPSVLPHNGAPESVHQSANHSTNHSATPSKKSSVQEPEALNRSDRDQPEAHSKRNSTNSTNQTVSD